jgi:hypothetical protein
MALEAVFGVILTAIFLDESVSSCGDRVAVLTGGASPHWPHRMQWRREGSVP